MSKSQAQQQQQQGILEKKMSIQDERIVLPPSDSVPITPDIQQDATVSFELQLRALLKEATAIPEYIAKQKYLDQKLGGHLIQGRFRVLQTLASKHLGAVFRCMDIFLNREVAVKVDVSLTSADLSAAQKQQNLNMFLRQSTLLTVLQCKQIVHIDYFGRTSQQMLYQVMEYIKGENLKEYLTRCGSMSDFRVASIARSTLSALEHAHQKGVVHRDLKPANIILNSDLRSVAIVDWGIAQWKPESVLNQEGSMHPSLADSINAVGTPAYMSPEQMAQLVDPRVVLDHRSDLFNIGLLMFECLTGTPAFAHYSRHRELTQAMNRLLYQQEAQQFVAELDLYTGWTLPLSGLDHGMQTILRKALQLDRKLRYQNAAELISDLLTYDHSEKLSKGMSGILDTLGTSWSRADHILDLSSEGPLELEAVERLLPALLDSLDVSQVILPAGSQLKSPAVVTQRIRKQLSLLQNRQPPVVIEGLFALDLAKQALDQNQQELAIAVVSLAAEVQQFATTLVEDALRSDDGPLLTVLLQRSANEILQAHQSLLHQVCKAGQLELLTILLSYPHYVACIEECDQHRFTPLHYACQHGSVELIDLLHQHGAKARARTEEEPCNVLWSAVQFGQTKACRYLLEVGVRELINEKSRDGSTPLWIACENGHTEIVDMFVRHRALEEERAQRKYGNTALGLACQKGHMQIVKLLLQATKGLHTLKKQKDFTALELAARSGHVEIVQLLIENGAISEIHKPNKHGNTPLMSASSKGHLEMVHLLIQHGAAESITHKNETNDTALSRASANGHYNVVHLLLRHGANKNINESNRDGWTPLALASYFGYVDVIALLLENGATETITQPNKDGFTPLLRASEKGHLTVVELLLKHGAIDAINFQNKNGDTALILASAKGFLDIVRLLLEHGAVEAVNVQNEEGFTALARASEKGYLEIVTLLLTYVNTDGINKKNKDGNTALSLASFNSHREVFRLLLNRGAKMSSSKE